MPLRSFYAGQFWGEDMNSVPNSFPNFNAGFFWTCGRGHARRRDVAVFLMGRRVIHSFRIRRYDELAFKIHNQWREIVRGGVPIETWRKDPMQCEIVQSIVIQESGAATDKDGQGCKKFLRASGLIDLCIEKVKEGHGMVEAASHSGAGRCACRSESLHYLKFPMTGSSRRDGRGARPGRTELAEAAEPSSRRSWSAASSAARSGHQCAAALLPRSPAAILPFLRRRKGSRANCWRAWRANWPPRDGREMIVLAEDPRPEVRAAAAKALSLARCRSRSRLW